MIMSPDDTLGFLKYSNAFDKGVAFYTSMIELHKKHKLPTDQVSIVRSATKILNQIAEDGPEQKDV
jgi:hypothetical protein